jgi:hypothetical protein
MWLIFGAGEVILTSETAVISDSECIKNKILKRSTIFAVYDSISARLFGVKLSESLTSFLSSLNVSELVHQFYNIYCNSAQYICY